ncbi:MAG: 4Fe-4S binding protein [Candidatus Hydrogenedentota bacterium]
MGEVKEGTQRSGWVANLNARHCILCGICQTVCPVEAISIGRSVMINQDICTGCGECVAACPQDALSLKKR